MNDEIEIGDLVRDTITGFTGIVIARTEFFNGCIRIMIQPQGLDEKGGKRSDEVFDVQQCEIVEKQKAIPAFRRKAKEARAPEKRTGGPVEGERRLFT